MVLVLALYAFWPQRGNTVLDPPHSDQTWQSGSLRLLTNEPRTIITPDIPKIGNGYPKECQCVHLVKEMRPDLAYISGYAKEWISKAKEVGDEPRIGAVVSTRESSAGHVALIVDMTIDKIRLYERNVPLGNCNNSYRWLSKDDPKIVKPYVYN